MAGAFRPITPKAPSFAASAFEQAAGRRHGPRTAREDARARRRRRCRPASSSAAAGMSSAVSGATSRLRGGRHGSRENTASADADRAVLADGHVVACPQLRQIGRAEHDDGNLDPYSSSPPQRRHARMRSGSASRIAAGATPARAASASTDEEDEEPRASAMTTTRPDNDAPRWGCRGSITTPGGGIQATPQRQRLIEHDRSALAVPAASTRPISVAASGAAPQRWIPPHASVDRRRTHSSPRAEDDLRADVAPARTRPTSPSRSSSGGASDAAPAPGSCRYRPAARRRRRAGAPPSRPPQRRPGRRERSRPAARLRQRRAFRRGASRSRSAPLDRGMRRSQRHRADGVPGWAPPRWSARLARRAAPPIRSLELLRLAAGERGLERWRLRRRPDHVEHRHRAGRGGRGGHAP